MAEIIGLISAIGGLTATAFKITKALSAVRDDLGVAASSVKAILDDTKAVSIILREIQSRISVAAYVNSDTMEMLELILRRCKEDIEDIERSRLPLIADASLGDFMSQRQRLRWFFANTLQLSDGFAVEQLKEEILEAITKTAGAKAAFLNAEKIDQAAARAYGTEDPAPEKVDEDPQPTSEEAGSNTQGGEDSDLAEMQLQTLSQSDLQMAFNISDDSYLWIAAHLTLQRSVTAFARVAMERQPTEAFRRPSNTTKVTRKDEGVEDIAGDRNTAAKEGSGNSATGIVTSPDDPSLRPMTTADEQHGNVQPPLENEPLLARPEEQAHGQPDGPPQQGEILVRRPRLAAFEDRGRGSEPPAFNGHVPPGPYYGETSPFGMKYMQAAPGFYGGLSPNLPVPPPHGYFDHPFHGPQPYPHVFQALQSPMQKPKPDQEKEQMRRELIAMKVEQDKREEQAQQKAKQTERDMRVRREAEESFHRRMDEMRRAQEEAKSQLENMRMESDTAAREQVAREMRVKEDMRRDREEHFRRIEYEVGQKAEAELRARTEKMERETRLKQLELEEQMKAVKEGKKRSLRDSLLGRGHGS
ncbi:hypothetical protein QBC34DRAFT_465893 [Podospora aff. communis PSN243]|uniref:Fungal N-terminal domain-containing protein n=1 Tax=Podospora aff. communis PSN243 TaxID=3040156 RepID=A0AAV9GJW3_9PEZI|nr:hypothetical protein QBC34DRAFT_465893 [Podospora aff. communis PSN243]